RREHYQTRCQYHNLVNQERDGQATSCADAKTDAAIRDHVGVPGARRHAGGTERAVSAPLRVGFVGLGDMGGAIVTRLLAAGLPVTLWARRPESLRQFGSGR